MTSAAATEAKASVRTNTLAKAGREKLRAHLVSGRLNAVVSCHTETPGEFWIAEFLRASSWLISDYEVGCAKVGSEPRHAENVSQLRQRT